MLCLTDLERGTNNFDTSVEFAVANVEHHKFLSTQPTRVKEGVRDLLDLLELKSQMGKRAAVSSAVLRLQALIEHAGTNPFTLSPFLDHCQGLTGRTLYRPRVRQLSALCDPASVD